MSNSKRPCLFDYSEKVFLNYMNTKKKEYLDDLEFSAFQANTASSFYFLAYIKYYAVGCEHDPIMAKIYLEEAIKLLPEVNIDDPRMYRLHELLAWIYESGEIATPDFERAYQLYLEATKSDNPVYSYERLGFLHYWGYGCNQNYFEAISCFIKAAENGSSFAHYYLGTMVRDGEGVEKNVAKAVEHFEKAAECGNEDAVSCLAFMYSKFYDEWETDFDKSISYYEKLTQMDSPRAQRMGWYGIGYAYLESKDADEYSLAINCLTKAAELGSEQAIELLNSL